MVACKVSPTSRVSTWWKAINAERQIRCVRYVVGYHAYEITIMRDVWFHLLQVKRWTRRTR